MNEEHDKAWADLAKRIRQGERHVISGADAERLIRDLQNERISEAEVDAIAEAVVSGRPLREGHDQETPPPDGDALYTAPELIEEDVLQLNRNKGSEDADAESKLEELRREALEDDDEESQGQ